MAITRRQFVTRMGALAAAMGLGQADMSRISEALAYGSWTGTLGKPRVVWVHGQECTGCSTSLLSIYEAADGIAVEGTGITTGAALNLAGDPLALLGGAAHSTFSSLENQPDGNCVNIADVVVEIVDLEYHETVQTMGGDLAYQWLYDFINSASNTDPFVLVVEGALPARTNTGAWTDTGTAVSWCSIGMNDAGTAEHDTAEVVAALAVKANCAAVIGIGQCATFGGYPACKAPLSAATAGFNSALAQTGTMGTYDFLMSSPSTSAAAAKVVNAPGCPTNPWWFVLTVVLILVEYEQGVFAGVDGPLGILTSTGAIKATAVDGTRRLKAVYGTPVHGPACPRYQDYVNGSFAAKPGDPGCLQKIGCKGPYTKSLCGLHGWNSLQPENKNLATASDYDLATSIYPIVGGKKPARGSHCTSAGHPCMACTEKGYPDSFVPFVVR
jgi:Ni,Fe-hydrogenase I small subunit